MKGGLPNLGHLVCYIISIHFLAGCLSPKPQSIYLLHSILVPILHSCDEKFDGRISISHRTQIFSGIPRILGILSPIANRGSTNFTSYGCNYQAYSYILLYRDPRSRRYVRFQRVRATQSDLFKRAVRALRNIPLSDFKYLSCITVCAAPAHIHAYIRACVRTHVPARRYVFLSRAQEKVHRSEEKRTIVSRSGVENRVTREE